MYKIEAFDNNNECIFRKEVSSYFELLVYIYNFDESNNHELKITKT